MILIVNRFTSDEDATISQVFLDGKFICFGLEDEYRTKKVYGETRIPAGKYEIRVKDYGKFHERYKKRFGHIHQGMLMIDKVPGFNNILIHCGNYESDTDGCLLVGTGAITEMNNMMVTNSTTAYRGLYRRVIGRAKQGRLVIKFVDDDLG